MAPRIYPDVNTSSASNTAANKLEHRIGEDVDTRDQLASPVLMGLAIAGGLVALVLVSLLIG